MNMKETIKSLFRRVDDALKKGGAARLPENTYFLDEKTVLCLPRKRGDSRYPYGADGFYLWAYQSGYIAANESAFTLFPLADEGKQPYIAFFAGVKGADGTYAPVSLTGAAPQPRERAERYTVYTPAAAYYLTRAEGMQLAVRVSVNRQKRIECTLYAENMLDAPRDIYLSFYMNCLMKFMPAEDVETKWYKQCKKTENGFVFKSVIDLSREKHVDYYAVIRRTAEGEVTGVSGTTSRADYAGGKCLPVNCAEPLFTGRFSEERPACSFTDTAVAGEIVRFHLPAGGCAQEGITLSVAQSAVIKEKLLSVPLTLAELDGSVERYEEADEKKYAAADMLRMRFSGFENGMEEGAFNCFLANVVRQVESCALAKTSSVSMLGVRDVFQQIEAALLWNRKDCRAKILEALGFIGVNGRAPRQYSLPADKNSVPLLDLRAFIDQGAWIIDALYTYLAYTGDYSVLDEICGYYVYEGDKARLTEERGSVLDHLVRIIGYLTGNLDRETGCLKILYGDWNDALDGLGTTEDAAEFGTGVSVMASLQLCKNLREMSEILNVRSLRPDLIEKYGNIYQTVKRGLLRYAVQVKDGKRRIVHGWGDKMSYFVGSFRDSDGKSRDGLAANAYWAIAGALEWDGSLKESILESFSRLDSKYGLKTFEPYFEVGTKGVGRIPNLPRGTAENGAAYVHATLFGVWALFLAGEEKAAWEQLYKALPITHKFISTSPFVMSNSYVYNEEFGMDGESMNDWYTGSAAVLVKVLTRCAFGVNVTQSKLKIAPAAYFPCVRAELRLKVRDCTVTVRYENKKNGKRRLRVNGETLRAAEYETELSALKNALTVETED